MNGINRVYYTIYWNDGTREVIACNQDSTILYNTDISFYGAGITNDYFWDQESMKWVVYADHITSLLSYREVKKNDLVEVLKTHNRYTVMMPNGDMISIRANEQVYCTVVNGFTTQCSVYIKPMDESTSYTTDIRVWSASEVSRAIDVFLQLVNQSGDVYRFTEEHVSSSPEEIKRVNRLTGDFYPSL